MTTTLTLEDHAMDVAGRLEAFEDRLDALLAKIDIIVDASRADAKLLLDRLDGFGAEMRREVATARKEHWADHRLLVSMLKEQSKQIEALERRIGRRDALGSP